MLEVNVKKEDLQAKIREEISKLESEWGDLLYKGTESIVVKSLESSKIIQNEWFSNRYGCSNGLNLELEEFKYVNANNIKYRKALISAIKRKDKLLNLSGMFNLASDNSISIDEGVYRFLYNEFGCEKPVYKPFKETKIYELLSKQVQERVIPKYNPEPLRDFWDSKPTSKRPTTNPPPPPVSIGSTIRDLGANKQEALWLSWLIVGIILGIVLIFTFK